VWRSAAQNEYATTPHTHSRRYNATNKIYDDKLFNYTTNFSHDQTHIRNNRKQHKFKDQQ
jgi:hypothetical protein